MRRKNEFIDGLRSALGDVFGDNNIEDDKKHGIPKNNARIDLLEDMLNRDD